MGIYDREYYRDEQKGVYLGGDRMMVTNIILFTVGVYILDLFLGDQQPLEKVFALKSNLGTEPWKAYQLLTYGFLHEERDLLHIAFNMLVLWFAGREVEAKYGRKEFLSLYLSLIVLSGLVWVITENAFAKNLATVIGASGAVTGMLVLFALNFPHRKILVWFVLPVPAWALVVLLILLDLSGAIHSRDSVAYTCHLGGAAFAFLYFRTGWHLGRLLPGMPSLRKLKPRPRLRVHDPDKHEQNLSQQVDQILKKIQEKGQDSLSKKERKILEEASRRYQQKHR